MREVELRHFRDFESELAVTELAAQLMILVHRNENELAARSINGPFARYGVDPGIGKAAIRRGQEQDDPEHFVAINSAGNVIGAASLFRTLELKWVTAPLPRKIIPKRFTSNVLDEAPPNITTWVDKKSLGELSSVYRQLDDMALLEAAPHSPVHSWPLEPADTPRIIHEAIRSAGLTPVDASRNYDDGESFKKYGLPTWGPVRALYLGDSSIAE